MDKENDEFKILEKITFNMILNLANVCNAESVTYFGDLLKTIIQN